MERGEMRSLDRFWITRDQVNTFPEHEEQPRWGRESGT